MGIPRGAGAHSRAGSCRGRTDPRRPRQAERRRLRGHDLSRAEKELRVQRRHLLVGRWNIRTAGLREAGRLHTAPGAGCSSSEDYRQFAGSDEGSVDNEGSSKLHSSISRETPTSKQQRSRGWRNGSFQSTRLFASTRIHFPLKRLVWSAAELSPVELFEGVDFRTRGSFIFEAG